MVRDPPFRAIQGPHFHNQWKARPYATISHHFGHINLFFTFFTHLLDVTCNTQGSWRCGRGLGTEGPVWQLGSTVRQRHRCRPQHHSVAAQAVVPWAPWAIDTSRVLQPVCRGVLFTRRSSQDCQLFASTSPTCPLLPHPIPSGMSSLEICQCDLIFSGAKTSSRRNKNR